MKKRTRQRKNKWRWIFTFGAKGPFGCNYPQSVECVVYAQRFELNWRRKSNAWGWGTKPSRDCRRNAFGQTNSVFYGPTLEVVLSSRTAVEWRSESECSRRSPCAAAPRRASALFGPVWGGLLLGSMFASPIAFPRNLKEHLKHVFSPSLCAADCSEGNTVSSAEDYIPGAFMTFIVSLEKGVFWENRILFVVSVSSVSF